MSRGLRIFLIIIISLFTIIATGIAILWFSPILGGTLPDTSIIFNPKSLETKANHSLNNEYEAQKPTNFPTSESILPTLTAEATESIESEQTQISPREVKTAQNSVPLPSQTPVCKGPEAMTFLVVVLDERIQADAIRLVRVDFINSTVSVLSIPRDFYVPIVDMGAYKITEGRINATYGYGETLLGKGKGIISLTDNLTYNFDISLDHYLVLHLNDIANYVDKVGGVDVYLDRPVSDGWSNFSKGDHHFDGETAVIFMRMRLYDDDFARVHRQTMLLKAFFKKVVTDLNPIEQTQIVLRILMDRTIQTDLSIKDITPLICLAGSLDSSNVTFFEVEKSMYRSHTTPGGANVLIPNDTVVPYIQSIMAGIYDR